MQAQISKEYSFVGPRQLDKFQQVAMDNSSVTSSETLRKMGIRFDSRNLKEMMNELGSPVAMDTAIPNLYVTTPSVTNPIQFLQNIVPGVIRQVVPARKIDVLTGIQMVGDWEDEQIVFRRSELTGSPVAYTDLSPIPLASWNMNFETRSMGRFELGMSVDRLEELRAAKMLFNSAAEKREAVILGLEMLRNRVGFYGYNNGAGRIYGFLNDPGLPSYITVAAGAESGNPTQWAYKTFQEITADIRTAVAQLRTQLAGNFPGFSERTTEMTLALGTNVYDRLTVTTDFGMSPLDWINKNYPGIRVVDAQELNGANGGSNVFYLYLDRIPNDISTDSGRVFDQMVSTKFMTIGVERHAKHYSEDYANGLAGVVCKRPLAIVRYSGI